MFFERLRLIPLLGTSEVHRIITSASRRLLSVHNDWNNFYNEPPFADRLMQLTKDVGVPESAQPVFVEAVMTCGIGNQYGVSNAAMPYYRAMVKSFSPKEVKTMLDLSATSGTVGARLKSFSTCRSMYQKLVGLLDESSVPSSAVTAYEKWKSSGSVDDTELP